MKNNYGLKHLGVPSAEPIDQVDRIPWKGSPVEITLCCNEFSTLCPVTGQPDFGTLRISYVPTTHLVETKSLKLYLLRFRNQGVFSEVLVDTIADDLFNQLAPRSLEVTGVFHSRGGISIQAVARRPLEAPRDPA